MLSQHREPLIEVCQIIAEQEHLEVTVKSAAKAALITGAGAFFGALIAGPIGVAVGGTIASVTTAITTKGTYRSVVDILQNDLTPQQQSKLAASVRRIVDNVKVEDVAALVTIITSRSTLKEAVIQEISSFLLKELNLHMIK